MVWFGGEKKYKYKIRRLTADLDTLSLTKLYWCLLIFKLFGFKYETTIRLSNSKNGRHVIAWCKHKGLHRGSMYLVRTLAGDDSVSEDTRLYWKENGILKFTKISDLYESFNVGNKISVLTAKIKEKKCRNENLKPLMTPSWTEITWGDVTDCWYKGERPVYLVELNNGKKIEVTKNHSLFGRERKKYGGCANRIVPSTFEQLITVASVDKSIDDYDIEGALNLYLEATFFTDMTDIQRKLYHLLLKHKDETLTSRQIYKEYRKKYGIPSTNNRGIPRRQTLNRYMNQFSKLGIITKKNTKTNQWEKWEIRENKRFDETRKIMLLQLKDLLLFCGLWLADGCYDGSHGIHISTGGDKNIINWIEKYISSFKNDYGKTVKVNISKFRTGDVIFSNYKLAGMMRYLGFEGNSHTKKIPSFVFTLPNELISLFLKGYFSGDGCLCLSHNRSRITSSSISKELIYGTRTLLNKLGLEVSVHSHIQKGGFGNEKRRKVFTLCIDEQNSVKKFLDEIGLIKKYDKKKYNVKSGRKNEFDIYLRKIKKTGYIGIKKVYDIEIKPTNSFVAEGILCHNSYRIKKDKQDRMIQILFYKKIKIEELKKLRELKK